MYIHQGISIENHVTNIPRLLTDIFVGRKPLLDLLQQKTTSRATKRIVCFGMPGVGKTQLSLEFARSSKPYFTHIFWVTASTHETIVKGYDEIGELVCSKDLIGVTEQQIRIKSVRRWLETSHLYGAALRWLLIYDNVTEDVIVRLRESFIPDIQESNGMVYCTTRYEKAA